MATFNCPLNKQDDWVSFQLVDEFGEGAPYANLNYTLGYVERGEYKEKKGTLNQQGYSGKITGLNTNAALLYFDEIYNLGDQDIWYDFLVNNRKVYKLPITQLQYVAEQTRRNHNARMAPLKTRVVTDCPAQYYGMHDIHHFVEKIFHLPEWTTQQTADNAAKVVRISTKQPVPSFGKGMKTGQHHVFPIRALRAYRPLLSKEKDFSALNLYQLGLFSNAAYRDFEEKSAPAKSPWYSKGNSEAKGYTVGTLGFIFNEWANYRKVYQFGKANMEPHTMVLKSQDWAPVLEDVAYSRRFEVVPFSVDEYPELNEIDTKRKGTENPGMVHFFEKPAKSISPIPDIIDWDKMFYWDTQAYMIHSDEVVIISPRGTNENPTDLVTDLKALQVLYEEGVGKAHKGFYGSFKLTKRFIAEYLRRFFIKDHHKVIVTGHSLGGAMATLTAEWIRRDPALNVPNKDLMLYTYASPRAGNKVFTDNASELTHYRAVSHLDPVPLLPFPAMSVSWPGLIAGVALTTINPVAGVAVAAASFFHIGGDDYVHHGKLFHFTTIDENLKPLTQRCDIGNNKFIECDAYNSPNIAMWHVDGGEKIEVRGVDKEITKRALVVIGGLPYENCKWYQSRRLVTQVDNHFMMKGYLPATWATFTRWRRAAENNSAVVIPFSYTIYEKQYHNRLKELEEAAVGVDHYLFPPNVNKNKNRSQQQNLNKYEKLKTQVIQLGLNLVRIKLLSEQIITDEMVYGKDILAHPEFNDIFERWEQDDQQRIKRIEDNYRKLNS